jgi:hypothetical protein
LAACAMAVPDSPTPSGLERSSLNSGSPKTSKTLNFCQQSRTPDLDGGTDLL